jgi:hypothetical protein
LRRRMIDGNGRYGSAAHQEAVQGFASTSQLEQVEWRFDGRYANHDAQYPGRSRSTRRPESWVFCILFLLSNILNWFLMWNLTIEMSELSSRLVDDSKKYLKDAKRLNWQALYRKYGPPSVVILVVLFVLYVRFWWF